MSEPLVAKDASPYNDWLMTINLDQGRFLSCE